MLRSAGSCYCSCGSFLASRTWRFKNGKFDRKEVRVFSRTVLVPVTDMIEEGKKYTIQRAAGRILDRLGDSPSDFSQCLLFGLKKKKKGPKA